PRPGHRHRDHDRPRAARQRRACRCDRAGPNRVVCPGVRARLLPEPGLRDRPGPVDRRPDLAPGRPQDPRGAPPVSREPTRPRRLHHGRAGEDGRHRGTSPSCLPPRAARRPRASLPRPRINSMSANADFVHLHVHTEYSMLDGASRLDDLFAEAQRLGQTAMATTDHGYLFGAYDFWRTARKYDIKPIIGVEAYVTPGTSRFDKTRVRWGEDSQRGDDVSARGAYTHMTLLAETTE